MADLSGTPDDELVQRFQAGDQNAYTVLVERYQTRVGRIAFSVLKDADEAMDVSQEAFLKVYKKIGSFRGGSSFYTWLYRITINMAIDRQRSRKRKWAQSLERGAGRPGEEAAFQIPDENPGPAITTADEELEAKINEVIDTLPPKHREVVLLREIENLSYQEIADTVGCSIGTVMSRLHYAREKLKEKLRPLLKDEDFDSE